MGRLLLSGPAGGEISIPDDVLVTVEAALGGALSEDHEVFFIRYVGQGDGLPASVKVTPVSAATPFGVVYDFHDSDFEPDRQEVERIRAVIRDDGVFDLTDQT